MTVTMNQEQWPAFDQCTPALHVSQDRYTLAATRSNVNFTPNTDPAFRGFTRTSEVSSLRGQGLISKQNASLLVANTRMLIYSMKDLQLRVILQSGTAMYKLCGAQDRGSYFIDLVIPNGSNDLDLVGIDDKGFLHIFDSDFDELSSGATGQAVGLLSQTDFGPPTRVFRHPTKMEVIYIVWPRRVQQLELLPSRWAQGVWSSTYEQATTAVLSLTEEDGDIEDIVMTNDGEYIFVLGRSKLVTVFSKEGEVLQRYDPSAKLGFADISSIRIVASDADEFQRHSLDCPEFLILVGDIGRRLVAVNIDKRGNHAILTNMLQSVWIDFAIPDHLPDGIANWQLHKRFEVKVDASLFSTVLIGNSKLLEVFALPLATGWSPDKGLPFPYLQVLGTGMPAHELFTLTGTSLVKADAHPKEALLVFTGRNFKRQKAGGATGLGCKIQVQELPIKRTGTSLPKDPARDPQSAGIAKAGPAKPPPPSLAPVSAEARGAAAIPKTRFPPGLSAPETADVRRVSPPTVTRDGTAAAAAKAAAAKAHAAAVAAAAAAAAEAGESPEAAGRAASAASPPSERELAASEAAEGEDAQARSVAGIASMNGTMPDSGAEEEAEEEGADVLDGQSPSPTAATEGDAAVAPTGAAAAARQDVDWGSVKRIGAAFIKGLQKKRGDLAEKIAGEVASIVAEQQASGQEADVQAEIDMLEEVLMKLRRIKAAQETSSEALRSASQQATDRWAEATQTAVAGMMQKELGRISEGVATNFAQQLTRNNQFTEALLSAIRHGNATASKRVLEAFRAPKELQPVVSEALSEALRDSMEPIFRSELRKHFLNDLTPLAGTHLEEMLKSFKVRVNECLERIAVEHEAAAKRLAEELAPVVQEELSAVQKLAAAHRRSAGSATNHLTDQQLAALSNAMHAEVVQPLHARIRDLTAQVKQLQAKAKALESKWAATAAQGGAGDSALYQNRAKLTDLVQQGKIQEAFTQATKCHTANADCIWFLCEKIGNVETVTGAIDEFTKLAVVAAVAELLAMQSSSLAHRRKEAMDWVKELWLALELTDPSVSEYAPLACARLNSHLEKIEAHADEEEKPSLRFLKRVVDQATRLLGK